MTSDERLQKGVLPRPALLAHPDHQYGNSMLIPQSSFQGGYHWWCHEMLSQRSWQWYNVIVQLHPFETLFRKHQGLMPMAKNCTLTNSAPIFAMTTMIIFMGVYPKTHTLLLAALEYWFFFCCFLPFKTIRPLWILCKRSARVGYLFRRENLGREHGLFLAAILQDFLFSFLFTVLVWDPCIPHYPVPILG